jgi:choline transport protein
VYERWHGTLIYWAYLVIATLVNIFAVRLLPWISHATFVMHVTFWVVLLVVMCVVSPAKHDAEFVFTTFVNETGWQSDGVAWSIGLLSSTYVLVGQSRSLC